MVWSIKTEPGATRLSLTARPPSRGHQAVEDSVPQGRGALSVGCAQESRALWMCSVCWELLAQASQNAPVLWAQGGSEGNKVDLVVGFLKRNNKKKNLVLAQLWTLALNAEKLGYFFKSGHRYFDMLCEDYKTSHYDRLFLFKLMLKYFMENKDIKHRELISKEREWPNLSVKVIMVFFNNEYFFPAFIKNGTRANPLLKETVSFFAFFFFFKWGVSQIISDGAKLILKWKKLAWQQVTSL